MNVCSSECVFPSYNKIKNRIVREQTQQYQQKIAVLSGRLANMQSRNDFKADHQVIKNSIITLSGQQITTHSPFLRESLKLESVHRTGDQNGESLNYYIEDDGEGENNYQTFLKFKKKVLERDLEQEENEHEGSTKQKKKQRQCEQQLFKNLFDSNRLKEIPRNENNHIKKFNNRAQSADAKKNFQYREAKEKAGMFLQKVQKGQTLKRRGVKRGRGSRVDEVQVERAAFQNNRKYLTDNYLQVLKKLQGTNIVKWRVLNADC